MVGSTGVLGCFARSNFPSARKSFCGVSRCCTPLRLRASYCLPGVALRLCCNALIACGVVGGPCLAGAGRDLFVFCTIGVRVGPRLRGVLLPEMAPAMEAGVRTEICRGPLLLCGVTAMAFLVILASWRNCAIGVSSSSFVFALGPRELRGVVLCRFRLGSCDMVVSD